MLNQAALLLGALGSAILFWGDSIVDTATLERGMVRGNSGNRKKKKNLRLTGIGLLFVSFLVQFISTFL